jgi:hypothetical protein
VEIIKYCKEFIHGDGHKININKIIKDCFNKLYLLFWTNKIQIYLIYLLHLLMGLEMVDSREEEIYIIGVYGPVEHYLKLIKIH